MIVLISLGLAGTVALLCATGLVWWRAASSGQVLPAPANPATAPALPPPETSPSRAWRCLHAVLRVLAPMVAPLLAERAALAVTRHLARAELDTLIDANAWVALCLLSLLAGVAAMPLCLLLPAHATACVLLLALAAAVVPWLWLMERVRGIRVSVLRDLPGCLDTLALALEAGCAFGAALQRVVERSAHSPLRRAWSRCLQEMRAGRVRRDALERLAQRLCVQALTATTAAIVQAEMTGISLAPVIRAQALRGTQERFARAEKLALEAPIRMLAPLVICIFPCTFIVIGFPIAATLIWGA